MNLESAGRSSFSVALSAVNWPSAVWLERNFTFLSAVGAGCLVHLFAVHYSFSTPVQLVSAKVRFAHAQVSCSFLFKLIHLKLTFSCSICLKKDLVTEKIVETISCVFLFFLASGMPCASLFFFESEPRNDRVFVRVRCLCGSVIRFCRTFPGLLRYF